VTVASRWFWRGDCFQPYWINAGLGAPFTRKYLDAGAQVLYERVTGRPSAASRR
jgi:hypothetical protein